MVPTKLSTSSSKKLRGEVRTRYGQKRVQKRRWCDIAPQFANKSVDTKPTVARSRARAPENETKTVKSF
jgi:hypothetical protein